MIRIYSFCNAPFLLINPFEYLFKTSKVSRMPNSRLQCLKRLEDVSLYCFPAVFSGRQMDRTCDFHLVKTPLDHYFSQWIHWISRLQL